MGLLGLACVDPVRTPLPAPAPLVRGGTPVPGNGVGIGLQLSDGLQGQELLRKELLVGSLLIGLDHRVGASASVFGGHDDGDPAGIQMAGKLRLGGPFGGRSSTAAYGGFAVVDRRDFEEQDESLTTLELSIPTELLLTDPAAPSLLSAYLGPRFVYESYRDHLPTDEDFEGLLPGGLAGLHLVVAGRLHLFAEGTVLWRPENEFRGATHGGTPVFLPSIGLATHLGSAFRWRR